MEKGEPCAKFTGHTVPHLNAMPKANQAVKVGYGIRWPQSLERIVEGSIRAALDGKSPPFSVIDSVAAPAYDHLP